MIGTSAVSSRARLATSHPVKLSGARFTSVTIARTAASACSSNAIASSALRAVATA